MARKPAHEPTSAFTATTRFVVLHGPEALLKALHVKALRQTLEAAHGSVDRFDFDGPSASLADVLDELRTFSLMSTYKLVVVDEADEFVKAHREALTRYAQSPVDHATLVLRANTWHPGNLDKAVAKVGGLIKCEAPAPAQLASWLVKRTASEHGRTLEARAAAMLVERIGSHMGLLDSEAAKLALMVDPNQPITAALVEEHVGRGADEDAWRVQESLLAAMLAGRGESPRPIEVIRDMIDKGDHPDVLIGYFVADLMRKLVLVDAMKRQGEPDATINKMLKLWPQRRGMIDRVLSRMPPGRAAVLFDRVIRADAAGKSGLGDTTRNLECFAAILTDG